MATARCAVQSPCRCPTELVVMTSNVHHWVCLASEQRRALSCVVEMYAAKRGVVASVLMRETPKGCYCVIAVRHRNACRGVAVSGDTMTWHRIGVSGQHMAGANGHIVTDAL